MIKKTKKVWSIRAEGAGFTLHDETGKQISSVPNKNLRSRLSDIAMERGADEVLHDYDLVKYDGSGSGT